MARGSGRGAGPQSRPGGMQSNGRSHAAAAGQGRARQGAQQLVGCLRLLLPLPPCPPHFPPLALPHAAAAWLQLPAAWLQLLAARPPTHLLGAVGVVQRCRGHRVERAGRAGGGAGERGGRGRHNVGAGEEGAEPPLKAVTQQPVGDGQAARLQQPAVASVQHGPAGRGGGRVQGSGTGRRVQGPVRKGAASRQGGRAGTNTARCRSRRLAARASSKHAAAKGTRSASRAARQCQKDVRGGVGQARCAEGACPAKGVVHMGSA